MIKCPLAQGPLWARTVESWLFEWPKVKASTHMRVYVGWGRGSYMGRARNHRHHLKYSTKQTKTTYLAGHHQLNHSGG